MIVERRTGGRIVSATNGALRKALGRIALALTGPAAAGPAASGRDVDLLLAEYVAEPWFAELLLLSDALREGAASFRRRHASTEEADC